MAWNCPDHPKGFHTWKFTGLDVYRGVLVSTRRCLRCPTEQVKTYGGRGTWRERRAEITA